MDAVTKDKAQKDLAKAAYELSQRPSRDEAENAVRTRIAWAGDDPKREGLIDTPGRARSTPMANGFQGLWRRPARIPLPHLRRREGL